MRPGFVGALAKIHQRLFRRISAAHVIVAQQEFPYLGAVERRSRTNRGRLESRRLRIAVGVESTCRATVIAGPEPTTTLFMRDGFPRHPICSWTFSSAPPAQTV